MLREHGEMIVQNLAPQGRELAVLEAFRLAASPGAKPLGVGSLAAVSEFGGSGCGRGCGFREDQWVSGYLPSILPGHLRTLLLSPAWVVMAV